MSRVISNVLFNLASFIIPPQIKCDQNLRLARTKQTARKSSCHVSRGKKFSFPRNNPWETYLAGFTKGDLAYFFGTSDSSGDSSSSSGEEESSGSEGYDDPKDGDYRGKASANQSSSSSRSSRHLRRRLDHASNTSSLTVSEKTPAATRPTDSRTTGSGSHSAVAIKLRFTPALTKSQGPPGGVVFSSIKPNTSNATGEPKLPVIPILDRILSSGTAESSGSPDSTTAIATKSKIPLSLGAEALLTSESRELASTPSTSGPLPATLFLQPTHPSPQDGVPTLDNSSSSNSQDDSAELAPNHSLSVADQLTRPQNVPETNAEKVLDGALVKETILNLSPAAGVEVNYDPWSILRYATFDFRKEPGASDMDPTPLFGGGQPGDFALTSSVSNQDDCMDVDEPVPPNDRVEVPNGMLDSLLSDPREIKVRRAMLLLRVLLRNHPSHPDVLAGGEEPFTVEEYLELVEKCSSLLSKYVTLYKGKELEERIAELDDRLQELSNTRVVQNLVAEDDARVRRHSPVRIDKGVATMVHEDHSEPPNLGQSLEQVEKLAGTMQDPATDTVTRQSLTPDATMVDLSSVPSTTASTGSDVREIESLSGKIITAAQVMTSKMRKLSDLLDCTYGNNGDDLKGKGREVDMVGPTTIGTPYDSPLISALRSEFESMEEEMRKSEQRSKEEIVSFARLHWAEQISPKEQTRATEKYQGETELLRHQHEEETDSLTDSAREAKKQREGGNLEAAGELPLLEILELRQRITTLENHIRPHTSPSQAGPYNSPVVEDRSDIWRPPVHPLGHLIDYDDTAPIQYETSTNSIPLPIKFQRKFQSMHGSPDSLNIF